MNHRSNAARLPMIAVALIATLVAVAAASAKDIVPPDKPGPFDVGVTTFSTTMTGGRVTRVQVFYPTFEPADPDFRYTIVAAAGAYELRSQLGVAGDAQALPFQFPLVAHDHGGARLGQHPQ